MVDNFDDIYMRKALDQAKLAEKAGEVPIGAVLVKDDQVIAESHNSPISLNDPTAHAEVRILRKAAEKLGNYRLNNTTLYVTLEPCAMCLGAMVHSRIKRLVFGAYDLKTGVIETRAKWAEHPMFNHHFAYKGGVMESECAGLLREFFLQRRR